MTSTFFLLVQKAVNPVGEILSQKKYGPEYSAYYRNNSIELDAHSVRESAKNYLLELIRRRKMVPHPTYYTGFLNTESNYATSIYRMESNLFKGLGSEDKESYFNFPNWGNSGQWDKTRRNFGIGQEPIDNVKSKIKYSMYWKTHKYFLPSL